jgi:hypothetical protein
MGMNDSDYIENYDGYLARREDIAEAQAALLKDTYEDIDDELYRFIMNAIVG